MRLSELITENPRNTKIILANKDSTGNALIRQCNLRSGTASFNIIAKTPAGIAKEIVDALSEEPVKLLSPDSSVYLMMNVLKDQKSAMFPESTITIGTTKEVLRCINELRENGVTEAYEKEAVNKGKIQELNLILNAYEKNLSDNNMYDRNRILRAAAVFCKEKKEGVVKRVPYLYGAVFGITEAGRWTTAEKDFLDALLSASESSGGKRYTVGFPEEESDAGISFYKARGIANEVRFAAEKMKKIAENESFGTISLYHSAPEYINFIKAVLDEERIPYCVSGGNPAKELHLAEFIISILDAAERDFSYELLEKAVRNRVITFDNVLKDDQDEDDETSEDVSGMTEAEIADQIAECTEKENAKRDSVRINPIRGYRHALSAGIGWGRKRYQTYYNRITNDSKAEENTKVFAGFLYDFVSVFDEQFSVGEIFRRLLEFVRRYTYARNPEKAILNNVLYEKCSDLMLIDSSGYSLKEKISFIRDIIENIKVEDVTEKEDAVCIYPLGDLFVMERKHNFMLGMSAAGFCGDDRQSPLLLDEEKKVYIKGADEDDSPVEMATKSYERLSDNVKKSLRTRIPDSDVCISYSYYDSIALRDSSPSVFFIEISDGKNIEEAPGYLEASYIIKDDIRVSVKELNESVKERAEEIEKKREEKRKKTEGDLGNEAADEENAAGTDTKKEFGLSASGIQTLLHCPLMYYYQYTKYLRIDDPVTPKGHEWLDARNRGNLCHFTMEKYMKGAKDPAAGIEQPLFDDAYDRSLKEVEAEQPAFSDEIKDREAKLYKEKIEIYIKFLADKWAEDMKEGKAWKVIGCEIPFGKNDETGSLKPFLSGKTESGEDYRIYLNGSIDRADGYMGEDGKLMLRIIDYKTGKKDSKEEEIKLDVQIQHYLYAKALRDYIESDQGKERIRTLFGRDYEDYDFEWVGYTFPFEEKDENRLLNAMEMLPYYFSDDPEDGDELIRDKDSIVTLPERIMKQLSDIIGNMLTGKEDLISGRMDELIHDKRKERKEDNDRTAGNEMLLSKFCEKNYCKYKAICRNWVGYAEKDAEGDEE
ncbi:MAG: PD-(D/E)XK nuclease family protein [Lachnospiraceae bacterium]|nr:PD-(D/E)XK nuclease family protein [Lachnospiraceae bacterium]